MALLIFLRWMAVISFLAFFISQVIIPLVGQRKLFPMFRKTSNQLENQIRETQSQLDEKALKEKLAELQARLNSPVVTPVESSRVPFDGEVSPRIHSETIDLIVKK